MKLMFVRAVCVHVMYVLLFFFFVDEQNEPNETGND